MSQGSSFGLQYKSEFEDICKYLDWIGLSEYKANFKVYGLEEFEILLLLSRADMEKIGIGTLGHQLRAVTRFQRDIPRIIQLRREVQSEVTIWSLIDLIV